METELSEEIDIEINDTSAQQQHEDVDSEIDKENEKLEDTEHTELTKQQEIDEKTPRCAGRYCRPCTIRKVCCWSWHTLFVSFY